MVAPYVLKRYTHDANSVGSGAPKNIVVTRFDPLTPVNQIRNTFSAFGEIARISNETDPNTGSFLGVCLIKYADRKSNNGGSSVCAVDAAKKAYAECKRGQCRVGLHKVQAELDRDLSVGRRAIAKAIERQRPRGHRREKLEEAPSRNPALDMPGPPPTAPKGPSGRPSGRGAPPPPPPPPEGPRGKPAVPNLIEETPILDQIKRKPYVYLAGCYVKVSSATVPHLEKRLRSYDWEAVRLDMTGYYVVFADSRRGEEEAQRCHDECNMKLLFDCTMNLDCHRYGNPNYERSPSPERVKAEQRQKAHQEKLRKEREVELEDEMKQRALNMDPVKGMVETLQHQLTMKLVEDFKSRVVATALFDYLDPACHSEKRRQLNIADPLDTRKPGAHHHDISRTHVGTPDSRNEGLSVGQQQFNSKSYTKVLPRIRKGVAYKIENSAFADERRQQRRPRKAPMRSTLQMYHQAMQDDISDDDRRTTVTRDTEEPESRPISRMSLASVDSDDESDGDTSQQAQAIIKEPERDHLEQAQEIADEGLTATDIVRETTTETLLADLNKLPRTSKKRKRLQEEYTALKKQKEDEELFGPCRTEDSLVQPISTPDKDSSLTTVEVIASEDAPETPDQDTEVTTTKVKKPKAKKKTKKQIFEEREALKKEQARAQIEELYPQPPKVDEIKLESQVESEPAKAEELPVSEVDWSVSKDEPRRIVVDDPDVVMDLDGWQHLLKDEEDLRFLRLALTHRPAARINNSATWAWKQKQIKALNQNGERGVIRKAAAIEGYYVPNPSGCARTEGTGKILESEKSKYLPHRLKVMKAREERQAQAKSNPSVAAAEAAKVAAAKSTSKSTSRSNRANNRRLVADLTAQKQMLATANGDSSAIEIEWNQLQKRKKAVKFDRSAIHNWGLYAMEDIVQGEMIIEYVGEKVRQQVADRREINYVKSGIGSSYLFRIDDTFVIDATKRGGIARFINHSCMPNCTARIISVKKDKRIVIYALKDIGQSKSIPIAHIPSRLLTPYRRRAHLRLQIRAGLG